MIEGGVERRIFYFEQEGKENLPRTVNLVAEYLNNSEISKVVVFTSDGEGPLMLARIVNPSDVKILAVTFPYKSTFIVEGPGGEPLEITPGTSLPEVKKELAQAGVLLLQGTLPFWEIIIPGTADIKRKAIKHTLQLLCGGFELCVEAVLVACDAGAVEPGEEVIAMSADTALVAVASQSSWMFHPSRGMEIREIICKPRRCTIIRSRYKNAPGSEARELEVED
ncbi:MAG TPA: hypothetical protein GXX39_05550 [Syntrophothermus lipocalidus]|nr:hypothetical protein [Syntrophothermus lipocalidus]